MTGRITSYTLQQSTLRDLAAQQSKLATLQAQESSGKKITKPSDDPAATAQLLSLKNEQRANAQYQRNATNANSWLSTADDALRNASNTLRTVRNLVVQAGDAALSGAGQQAIATQIAGLKNELLSTANTQYVGRNVFAGTSDTAAYAADYTFSGTAGSSVTRQIGTSSSVRVDVDGSAVFGSGSDSVFGLLDQITTTLRAGGSVSDQLGALDAYSGKITTALAGVGAAESTVSDAQSSLSSSSVTLTGQVSDLEDIDIAQSYLAVSAQQVAYQGAMASASKLLQKSLLDYIS